MPWKVSNVVDERMRFVVLLEQGERMSELCRQFGISRKTGYKILKRFQEHGAKGLYDNPRAPLSVPTKTAPAMEQKIVDFRDKHPTWGPLKIKEVLERENPGVEFPAASTIGLILKRNGLSYPKKRRRGAYPIQSKIADSQAPNDVWCADFKGQFQMGNRRLCYPLTVSDHFSRYLICCEGLENTKTYGAIGAFELAFRTFGLPDAIRTDNGAPFASTGLLGMTALSVWWMRLGIELQRIEPGHPEQNGRHERMHLTLKQEATRPPGRNLLQQQERFDEFVDTFNDKRPHQALDMKVPASFYHKSKREFPEELPPLKYPLHDFSRKVNSGGSIQLFPNVKMTYISKAFAEQEVGCREIEPSRWLVTFMEMDIGIIDESSFKLNAGAVPPMGGPQED